MYINGSADATTMSASHASTSVYESRDAKALRRAIYYTMHGIVGLLIVLFNGFVILAYAKREKLRRLISMVMMNLYIFCFVHGLIVGIVWPLQRVYRYSMGDELCIITTLVMDFADNYILVLLPVLAIERFIHVKYPHVSKKKMRVWSIISVVAALLVTVCYAWLPLIPDLEIPMAEQLSHDNAGRLADISRQVVDISRQVVDISRQVVHPLSSSCKLKNYSLLLNITHKRRDKYSHTLKCVLQSLSSLHFFKFLQQTKTREMQILLNCSTDLHLNLNKISNTLLNWV